MSFPLWFPARLLKIVFRYPIHQWEALTALGFYYIRSPGLDPAAPFSAKFHQQTLQLFQRADGMLKSGKYYNLLVEGDRGGVCVCVEREGW